MPDHVSRTGLDRIQAADRRLQVGAEPVLALVGAGRGNQPRVVERPVHTAPAINAGQVAPEEWAHAQAFALDRGRKRKRAGLDQLLHVAHSLPSALLEAGGIIKLAGVLLEFVL